MHACGCRRSQSALQLAAKAGRLDCARALLAAGADVNRVRAAAVAAGAAAAQQQQLASLGGRADTHICCAGMQASEDSSPLLQAAAFGHVDMARLLLEHKADPAATWVRTPLARSRVPAAACSSSAHAAFQLHCPSTHPLADWLPRVAGCGPAQAGNSALHMAARFGRMEVLRLLAPLLELPAAVAAVNADGKSPLMLACSQQGGGDDVVAWLLEAGADPAAADAVRDEGGPTGMAQRLAGVCSS